MEKDKVVYFHNTRLDPEKVEQAEFDYKLFRKKQAGHFTSCIFMAATIADPTNSYKLATAFPEMAYVVAKYQQKPILNSFREGEVQ